MGNVEQFDTHFALIYAQNEDLGQLEVRLHYSRCGEVEIFFITQSALMDPEKPTVESSPNFAHYGLRNWPFKKWQ